MFKLNDILKSKTESDIYNYVEQLKDNLNECYNLTDYYREAEDLGSGIFQVDLFINDVFINTVAAIQFFYKKVSDRVYVYSFKFDLNIIESFK